MLLLGVPPRIFYDGDVELQLVACVAVPNIAPLAAMPPSMRWPAPNFPRKNGRLPSATKADLYPGGSQGGALVTAVGRGAGDGEIAEFGRHFGGSTPELFSTGAW
ncbi:hypothetical protein DL771_009487 [Monosporascus sp. 5C6A]|nr:hypothetical protein DL771_009487 [Monosporascus sp. 5C6A]